MRNAGKRDRGRERAFAPLGKHYSFPYSQSDPVSFAECVGYAISFSGADIRVSCFQPSSNGLGWFHTGAGEFIRAFPESSSQTEAVKINIRDAVTLIRAAHFLSFVSSYRSRRRRPPRTYVIANFQHEEQKQNCR